MGVPGEKISMSLEDIEAVDIEKTSSDSAEELGKSIESEVLDELYNEEVHPFSPSEILTRVQLIDLQLYEYKRLQILAKDDKKLDIEVIKEKIDYLWSLRRTLIMDYKF